MLKTVLNRAKRTFNDALYAVAPIWHLTNLRREAVDQLEDLHYQIGLCQANKNQIQERLQEVEYLLSDPDNDKDTIFALETEKRQLEASLQEAEEMEKKAIEFLNAYQGSLPKIVSQLDMAIQMSRQAKSQKTMAKLLTADSGMDGTNVDNHIKKVRAQAYAASEQIRGRLQASSFKKVKMLPK